MEDETKNINIAICDECGSEYYRDTSKMESLCPECSFVLYGYENCNHNFEKGRCLKCFWNGSVSDYVKNLKMQEIKTTISPDLQAHFPLIVSLLEEHKIKEAYLFGSAVTDKFDENKSDVDILVNFIDGLDPLEKGELLWSLRFSLEDKLNRPIDLITETSLKNPYFIEEVNEKK